MRHEFDWDENLRAIPKDLASLKEEIEVLQNSFSSNQSVEKHVSALGKLGAYLCIVGSPVEAEVHLRKALGLIQQESLGIQKEIQQKIRLGTALQFQCRFSESNPLFESIIEVCKMDQQAGVFLDFALQHAGKNFFDQKKYQEAKSAFSKALAIRLAKNASPDLIGSCEKAIKRINELLKF